MGDSRIESAKKLLATGRRPADATKNRGLSISPLCRLVPSRGLGIQ
jgi:hypothetical protein